jgi:putative transposase
MQMEAVKRRRLGEQGWREVLGRFEAAGTTVDEFCRREGIGQSSLHRWRARLASTATRHAGARKKTHELQKMAASSFVDLGALGASTVSMQPRLELKLDLGGGVTLHLVRS